MQSLIPSSLAENILFCFLAELVKTNKASAEDKLCYNELLIFLHLSEAQIKTVKARVQKVVPAARRDGPMDKAAFLNVARNILKSKLEPVDLAQAVQGLALVVDATEQIPSDIAAVLNSMEDEALRLESNSQNSVDYDPSILVEDHSSADEIQAAKQESDSFFRESAPSESLEDLLASLEADIETPKMDGSQEHVQVSQEQIQVSQEQVQIAVEPEINHKAPDQADSTVVTASPAELKESPQESKEESPMPLSEPAQRQSGALAKWADKLQAQIPKIMPMVHSLWDRFQAPPEYRPPLDLSQYLIPEKLETRALNYVDIRVRTLAWFFDFIFFMPCVFFFSMILSPFVIGLYSFGLSFIGLPLLFLPSLALYFCISKIEASAYQGSPGKILCGIKVCNADASQITLRQSLTRNATIYGIPAAASILISLISSFLPSLGWIFSILFNLALLGLAWMYFMSSRDPKNQTAYDRFAGCVLLQRFNANQDVSLKKA